MKQISIKVSAVGKPTVEALGFNGQGCEAATKGIETKLAGGNVEGRELKPEYTNAEEVQQDYLHY